MIYIIILTHFICRIMYNILFLKILNVLDIRVSKERFSRLSNFKTSKFQELLV